MCGEALVDVVDGRESLGGGPFNTARALGRLGVPVAFAGHLSNDAQGRRLAEALAADGVSLELATFGPEPTTVATASVDESGNARYEFVIEGTSAPQLTALTLPDAVAAIQLGSLGLVLEPMASTLLDLAARECRKRLVVLDPNVRPGLIDDSTYRRRLLQQISFSAVVKASDADLAWIYPGLTHVEAAERLMEEGVRLVVVTLGAAGAFAAHGGRRVSVPARVMKLVDTIGAGDAFGAALLAWLHDHQELDRELALDESQLREALEFAGVAAAIACSRAGADPPWRRETQPTTR